MIHDRLTQAHSAKRATHGSLRLAARFGVLAAAALAACNSGALLIGIPYGSSDAAPGESALDGGGRTVGSDVPPDDSLSVTLDADTVESSMGSVLDTICPNSCPIFCAAEYECDAPCDTVGASCLSRDLGLLLTCTSNGWDCSFDGIGSMESCFSMCLSIDPDSGAVVPRDAD